MADDSVLFSGSVRDRILDVAQRLFYQNGIRATGVDRIIAESGVAKMSFYRHFPSKKDLVLAFLEWRHRYWIGWFERRVTELLRRQPDSGLSVMADALYEWFQEPGFRGCAFINIVAESGYDGEDERHIALAHKTELMNFIKTLLPDRSDSCASHSANLALLVIEGTIVRAQMTGNPEIAKEAGKLLNMIENVSGQ